MKRYLSLGAVFAAVFALSVSASTFVAMSQDDLLRSSTAVVQGKVLQVDSYWNDTNQIIFSDVLVEVEDEVLGKADSLITVRTVGGEVDGFRVDAHGFPAFEVEDRVLMFLEPDGKDSLKVAGYQQGLFRIVTDEAGIEMAIPATELETNIITLDGQKASLPSAQTLDDLKSSIVDDAAALGLIHQ